MIDVRLKRIPYHNGTKETQIMSQISSSYLKYVTYNLYWLTFEVLRVLSMKYLPVGLLKSKLVVILSQKISFEKLKTKQISLSLIPNIVGL